MLRSHSRTRGFTLIELVAVMLLLTVIAAIVAPRLGGFIAGRHVQEECRRFLAMTRYASEEAVSRGERMEVRIYDDGGSYEVRPAQLADGDDAQGISYNCQDKLKLTVDAEDSDNEDATNEDGDVTILIWPDGAIDETSPKTITLTEDGSAVYEFVLDESGLFYTAEEATGEV